MWSGFGSGWFKLVQVGLACGLGLVQVGLNWFRVCFLVQVGSNWFRVSLMLHRVVQSGSGWFKVVKVGLACGLVWFRLVCFGSGWFGVWSGFLKGFLKALHGF